MSTTPAFVLNWDTDGTRLYETGTDRGVLYVMEGTTYGEGVAWNGLTAVTESPSGAEETAQYADNIKYLSLRSEEEFGATIEAFTYPDKWALCDGSAEVENLAGVTFGQQPRKKFGLCYRTILGNDSDLNEHGYKLHLVYGCTASPSEKSYATVNDSPEAITFSWEISATKVAVEGYKPVASITIDSTKLASSKLTLLEKKLYGTPADGQTAAVPPALPTPTELLTLLA